MYYWHGRKSGNITQSFQKPNLYKFLQNIKFAKILCNKYFCYISVIIYDINTMKTIIFFFYELQKNTVQWNWCIIFVVDDKPKWVFMGKWKSCRKPLNLHTKRKSFSYFPVDSLDKVNENLKCWYLQKCEMW